MSHGLDVILQYAVESISFLSTIFKEENGNIFFQNMLHVAHQSFSSKARQWEVTCKQHLSDIMMSLCIPLYSTFHDLVS
jgi:hypothetical protein